VALFLAAALLRLEPEAVTRDAAGYSANKAFVCGAALDRIGGEVGLLLSRSRGVDIERRSAVELRRSERCGGAGDTPTSCCSFSAVLHRPSTQLAVWWLTATPAFMAGSSSTSIWRPCEGREAALVFPSGPSGLVPGVGEEGRRCCSLISGGVKGHDCVLQIFCRVFVAKSKVCVVFVLSFEDLYVIVPAPLL
jgi:hypothetical protein